MIFRRTRQQSPPVSEGVYRDMQANSARRAYAALRFGTPMLLEMPDTPALLKDIDRRITALEQTKEDN